jgi:preprotein translocase subunit SecD
MKSIIYLFIAIVVSIVLTSSYQKTPYGIRTLTLQSTGSNVGPVSLKQSADIVSERLKLFGISSYDVSVLADKGQLRIQLPENNDITDIEGLVSSKGDIAFFETFTHNEIEDMLKPDNQLFRLLNQDNIKSSSDPRVGCTDDNEYKKTDDYLHSSVPLKNCKLTWGTESKKSGNCLFALKTNEKGNPLLIRSDIESVNIAKITDMQGIKIQIKLKPGAATIFAEATRNNIHKCIAVVIDDKVISWPRVQDAIEGGEVEVTGDFTEKEAKYFPVIFNTAQLPLSFKLLK